MSMDFETAHFNMVAQQIRTWDVLDPTVLAACSQVARDLFVPAAYRNLAYADTEIELGHGQCMMSPKIEARLLQSLGIRSSDRVLEVGTGSGYLTALLATLAAHVTSIEIFSEVSAQAKANLRQAGIANAKLHVGDAIDGWNTAEPYDVIVLTGSCPERRASVERQLSIGGRLFAVLGDAPMMEATLLTRLSQDTWDVEGLFDTELAPLIGATRAAEFQF